MNRIVGGVARRLGLGWRSLGRRKWLLAALLAWGLVVALWQAPVVDRLAAPVTELRGIWLTNRGASLMFYGTRLDEVVANLARHRLNTLYPAVWNRGKSLHPSTVLRKASGDRTWRLPLDSFAPDVLAGVVEQAQRQHLRVLPWFEYGLMVPPGSAIARAHPDWLTATREGATAVPMGADLVNPKGPRVSYLNPAHPAVRRFLTGLIGEVVRRYPVDGIQLDDHFALPVVLGYDAYTRELYRTEQGQLPPDDALDPTWMAWRAGKLTELMGEIAAAVRSVRPGAVLSLSPNPLEFAYRTSLQDWGTWVDRGLVDEVVVQLYRSSLKALAADLGSGSLQGMRGKVPVSVGLYTGPFLKVKGLDRLKEEVAMVQEAGFAGVSFFSWETTLWVMKGGSMEAVRKGFGEMFRGTSSSRDSEARSTSLSH